MTALPAKFSAAGFDFRQIARQGDAAVFEKRKSDLNVCFEVVRIRRMPKSVMFGRIIEAREVMPGNELWGLYGWTYCDKAAAFRRFQELVQKRSPSLTRGRASHAGDSTPQIINHNPKKELIWTKR